MAAWGYLEIAPLSGQVRVIKQHLTGYILEGGGPYRLVGQYLHVFPGILPCSSLGFDFGRSHMALF
jgi:hypothetical protein